MKSLYNLKSLTAAVLALLALPLSAQDMALVHTDPLSTEPATEVAEEKEEEVPSFTLTGYVDAYYQANPLNNEADEPLLAPTSFTGFSNTFGIGNVNLLAEKSLGKVSFVGQIGFGPRAVAANGGDGNFSSTVQQLYVAYSPSENVTFTLGNFGTFVGYEVIDAPANMNYSTSYLFSNGPFYHTGAKVDVAIAEGFGAMVGIFNDTDGKIDAVPGKHLGAQLSFESGGFAGYLNGLYGKDSAGETSEDEDDTNEFQIDFTGTFEVSETLMFGLNASSYGTSVDGNDAGGFFGTALYSTIGLTENANLSLRAEYFSENAAEGVSTDMRSVLGLTATGNITIGDLRIMPEVRFDNGSNFTDINGVDSAIDFGGDADDTGALTLILAAVYSF